MRFDYDIIDMDVIISWDSEEQNTCLQRCVVKFFISRKQYRSK